MRQDLRAFTEAYERDNPGEVVRGREPISIDFDVMAVVLEYERRRRYPIILFEQVRDYDIPIVCNVRRQPPRARLRARRARVRARR